MQYKKFLASLQKAVDEFNKWDKSETIQIVSHLDADGISASAILIKALERDNRKYAISILKQLDKEKIKELASTENKHIVFTDLGSGQLSDIAESLSDKKILILDHHQPEDIEADNVIHVNPHLNGIDGSKEISGAGVVFLFSKELNDRNKDLARIAIVGAICDMQERKGNFKKLNKDILDIAVRDNKIEIDKGLRLFGVQTKPIHKALEYCSDPFIPGVSGSESGSIQFLHQLGIQPKQGNKWRRIIDLDEAERKRLISGVIMRRLEEENPEDVLGNNYVLLDEEEGSPMRDAKEFATLLNACGRMDNASFGIGVCLGREKDRKKALQTSKEYKREIVNALKWYNNNEDKVVNKQGFLIINAEENVPPTIIGTLASILSKSTDIEENNYILSLARTDKNMTKISLRMSGLRKKRDIDLRDVLKEIIDEVGGESGGHKEAAGALIDTEKEAYFVEVAEKVLSKRFLSLKKQKL